MTTIYLPGDKVPLKIDDLTVYVHQLTMAQRAAIIEKLSEKDNPQASLEATKLALKYGVREITGVERTDGSPFSVVLHEGSLSDDSVEALLYLPCTGKIQLACFALLAGISNPLVDAAGKPIPGVEVITAALPSKKRTPSKN